MCQLKCFSIVAVQKRSIKSELNYLAAKEY